MSTEHQRNDLPTDLQALAAHVLGSRVLADEWMSSPAVAFDGWRPADMLRTSKGREAVRELLLRIEYGVYS